MPIHISSVGTNATICCSFDEDVSETTCNWNVTFSTVEAIFSEIVDFNSTVPRNWSYCPSNVTCYSNFNSINNNSIYYVNHSEIFMKDSVDGRLGCRLGGDDNCIMSHEDIDGAKNFMTTGESFFDCLMNSTQDDVVSDAEMIDSKVLFYIITMCISLPFFIATFVIYTILPELNNLHGFILRAYTACCFVAFTTMVTVFLHQSLACDNTLGIIMHFALLAMFFWLNVMSFDIWWTVLFPENRTKQSSRKKKIIYSIYAWGTSMLFIAVGFIVQFVPNLPEGLIEPGLEVDCWLGTTPSQLVYVQGPMCITLCINICFFASTAIKIFRQRNISTEHHEQSDPPRYNDEKNRFYICLKLLVAMGIAWLHEVISMVWVLPDSLTCILSIPTVLQGPLIFLIFVWNDRVKRLLSIRLGLKERSVTESIELTSSGIFTLT